VPDHLFEFFRRDLFARRGLGWDVLDRLADRFDVAAGDADHEAAFGDQRVRAAKRLRDRGVGALGDEHFLAARNHHGFGVSGQGYFFAHVHSVLTVSLSPSSALLSVCHASVAHFTRAGNSDTPENAARRPSSAVLRLPGSPVTSLWNTSKS